jgi:hypothetical protein
MPIATLEDLFGRLIESCTSAQVHEVLAEIGDHADVELNQPFGPLGLVWHEYGDRLSNFSSIGLGTKPGRSLTERLTNAMDAILEMRVVRGVILPASCRSAAQQWFGRPITGPDDGLYKWDYETDYDRMVQVMLLESGADSAPTIDVIDRGIGIRAVDFPTTILSLQEGNKLTRLYLIGAFGQGGAATLAFCDYVLVVSRHRDSPSEIGYTLIRVIRLGELYKEDAYGYLALPTFRGHQVPTVSRDGPLTLLGEFTGSRSPMLVDHGTLVRHFAYKLPGISGALGPGEGNLYHYLHVSMFDPLLPFRVIDARDVTKPNDQLVTGARNRLMRLAKKKEDGKEGRIESRHYRPMEYIVPHGTAETSLGVEYWVVYAYRKPSKGAEGDLQLRSSSNELFVQRNYPIIGTLNGQNQGELPAKLIREVGLAMTARHIVVHVDASAASSRVRRELFSTNREGFKEGDILRDLIRVLQRMLEEDEELQKIEKELTDRLTKRETEQTNQEVVDQITRLLLDAGMKVAQEGTVPAPGTGESQPVPEKKRAPYRQADPLPTLPFPQVTRFAIVSPKEAMRVRQNDHEIVLVETDADSEYDRQGRIAIRCEPGALEQLGKAPLRGGRVRWRLRPVADAKVGVTGQVVVSITRPDGTQLQDAITFEVLAPREETAKKNKGLVPPFSVHPVSPDNTGLWEQVWPDLGEGVAPEDQATVAYKAITAGGLIKVYYSTVFGAYKQAIDRLKQESPVVAQLFETNYAVWVGYHAILQENAKAEMPVEIDDTAADQMLEQDRVRVAKMQVKQALQTARLRQQYMKQEEEGGGPAG